MGRNRKFSFKTIFKKKKKNKNNKDKEMELIIYIRRRLVGIRSKYKYVTTGLTVWRLSGDLSVRYQRGAPERGFGSRRPRRPACTLLTVPCGLRPPSRWHSVWTGPPAAPQRLWGRSRRKVQTASAGSCGAQGPPAVVQLSWVHLLPSLRREKTKSYCPKHFQQQNSVMDDHSYSLILRDFFRPSRK